MVTHLSFSSGFIFAFSLVADGALRKSVKHRPHYVPETIPCTLDEGHVLGPELWQVSGTESRSWVSALQRPLVPE